MHIVRTASELDEILDSYATQRTSLVPTMGNLHAGHTALLQAAQAAAEHTVVSVFVNPLQFNQVADFNTYPRTEAEDIALLKSYGTDLVFIPNIEEMYSQGEAKTIKAGTLAQGLCGDFRPHHFDGVATVIAHLFTMVKPDIAVFGRKDYQQLCIIKDLVQSLQLDVEILSIPTQRNAQGLALSSRNKHLSDTEMQQAPELYRVLKDIAQTIANDKSITLKSVENLLSAGRKRLEASGFTVEYIEIRQGDTLQEVTDWQGRPLVILVAAWIGTTRLIDNTLLQA